MENNKTKSINPKLLTGLIILSVALGVILIAVTIAFWQISVEAKQTENTLEGVYSSAYYSMVDNVNNLHVDTAKFETLSNVDAQRTALKSMSQDCDYILAGLAVLPIDMSNVLATTKFFNQVNGMCEALIKKLDSNKTLSAQDLNIITNVSFVLGKLKSQLNEHNQIILAGNYNFVDASVFNNKGLSEFSSSLGDMSSDAIEYPAMIFDGPFSSALETKVINGLTKETVSEQQAVDFLKDKVFKDRNVKIKFQQKTEGDFVTYDFEITEGKDIFYAQIAERGAFLLTLSGVSGEEDLRIDTDEAIKIAENYAKQLGLDNLKSVWLETYENISYINLAPVINDIIMYPDLIKAKVDLTDSQVIGWEARNYAFNHINRPNGTSVSKSQAVAKMEDDYKLINTNLAYIPLEDKSEVLTYELVCEKMDGLYYFYVNAKDAKIEKILKVVETDKDVKLLV